MSCVLTIYTNLQLDLVLSDTHEIQVFPVFAGMVLGSLMMAIIIILGVGITLGYFYKRLVFKTQHLHIILGFVFEVRLI